MYCSKECRLSAFSLYHLIECCCKGENYAVGDRLTPVMHRVFTNGRADTENFFRANDGDKYLMELDCSDPEIFKKNQLLCASNTTWLTPNLSALKKYQTPKQFIKARKHFKEYKGIIGPRITKVIEKFYRKLFTYVEAPQLKCGAVEFGPNRICSMISPLFDCFHHSCNPNLRKMYMDGYQVAFVFKPIKEGEELFVTYSSNFAFTPKIERNLELIKEYDYKCKCIACKKNFPTWRDMRSENPRTHLKYMIKCNILETELKTMSAVEIQRKIREIGETIESEHFPTFENTARQGLILACLESLTQPEFKFK